MTLSDFATRVRRWMRDISQEAVDLSTEIAPTLEDFIRENYQKLVRNQPRFYRAQDTYTGVVDGEGDDSSLFELPDDFYFVGNLRRSDIQDKPKLKFITNHLDIDKYRYATNYQFYDPDPQVPIQTVETWTLYDSEYFQILPTPTSDAQTYELNYYRKWEEASQETDEVDAPESAISFLVAGVAHDLLLTSNDATAAPVRARLMEIITNFTQTSEQIRKGVLPEVEQWWGR